ncbi:non-hydrolyzing UDP-N-acetylglucosamine 2-epimerase [Flexivirga oryzae]|uniref:UDP-N-acetylglucosamine 2-epimerase (non-hydrolyzing) n=1 Tax=Flexivirga oryzae TaxID=1794944 RepID=A0A839N4L6_9MICO|nr:UDP-N-acetylglucosamine 2-epimerase (non-hydrolyzing) [Flexivirga oryzae]MBB2890165.1 UDP-N-acetylglucosamine 2-epimerase (non-hydrolyzing) [Flexivirga oryzae]
MDAELAAGAGPSARFAKRKVLVVVGTRPEATKLLPLIRAMTSDRLIEPFVIATGQHSGIVESVLALDGLAPHANLGVGRPGITLNELFARVLVGLQGFCIDQFGPADKKVGERDYNAYPAACVVHGDTSTAAAAALSAFHLQIPVIHVEAGLRTSNTLSPFPEELNRQMISRIATFHAAPTHVNKERLIREGIPTGRIFVCGNTAIDALQWAAAMKVPYGAPELADLEDDETTRVVVVTTHRRENWGEGLRRIAAAIVTLSTSYPQVRFVLPLHPNPRVAQTLRPMLEAKPNVSLVEPMNYLGFARLLGRACFAISDSGGVQEEAPSLGTPVLVVRETTERQEGVDAGTLKLVGTNTERIVAAASELLDDPGARESMQSVENPYGDGHTAARIVSAMRHIAFGKQSPDSYQSGFNRIEVLRAAGWDHDPSAITRPAPGRGIAEPSGQDPIEEVALR